VAINRDHGRIDEDSGLLAAARLGHESAFGRLIDHHREDLQLYCELMLGCPDRAREAVQDALLRGWRELNRADPSGPARIWLYRLATDICLEDHDGTDQFRYPRPLDHVKDDDGAKDDDG
jgi:DNA-directed RNA polymerase specialized sigma24 family protein